VKNYWPISLLSNISKILEWIVRLVFCSHLLSKLQSFKISGSLWQWLQVYLSNRFSLFQPIYSNLLAVESKVPRVVSWDHFFSSCLWMIYLILLLKVKHYSSLMIPNALSFSISARSDGFKLHHSTSTTNKEQQFYYAVPLININLSIHTIRSKVTIHFWGHFTHNFDPLDPHRLHYTFVPAVTVWPNTSPLTTHQFNFTLGCRPYIPTVPQYTTIYVPTQCYLYVNHNLCMCVL